MKKNVSGRMAVCLAVLLFSTAAAAFEAVHPNGGKTPATTGTVQVAFTPGDDAAGLIVEAIEHAQKQVLVQAYSFTHREIAQALVSAKRRGVAVQVIADAEQARKTDHGQVAAVAARGVPSYLDGLHDSAHNKVIIIDPETAHPVLITGSYNFTHAAQRRNAENLLIFRNNRELTAAYLENWQRHREHALPYTGRGKPW
ncbi:MAG: phospholipase D family protein [Pseudomonadota bacterium]